MARTGTIRFSLMGFLVLACGVVSWVSLVQCGAGISLEAVSPKQGLIEESFVEPAQTRLEQTNLISMPVAGRIGRIELQPGDTVQRGQRLVEFDRVPFQQALTEAEAAVAELHAEIDVQENNDLEESFRLETEATLQAAQESLKAASAQVEAEQARADRATKELERIKELAKKNQVSQSQLDDAQLEADTSTIELRRQEFYRAAFNTLMVAFHLGPKYVDDYLTKKRLQRAVTAQQLVQAQSRLEKAKYELDLTEVLSPIDGVVLERFTESGGTLAAGESLLLLGNLDQLEVIADILTQDAMKLQPGTTVWMEAAMGVEPITGTVKRVEPAGFTKVSSLGVEQQRVNAIIALATRPAGLGVGFHVRARFVTATKDTALIVPRYSVLQDPDGTYYVFLIDRDRLKKQPVTIGLRNDLQLEILDSLTTQDRIVLRPEATLNDGEPVRAAN